jgi:type IV secretory pathway VirB6-like protein
MSNIFQTMSTRIKTQRANAICKDTCCIVFQLTLLAVEMSLCNRHQLMKAPIYYMRENYTMQLREISPSKQANLVTNTHTQSNTQQSSLWAKTPKAKNATLKRLTKNIKVCFKKPTWASYKWRTRPMGKHIKAPDKNPVGIITGTNRSCLAGGPLKVAKRSGIIGS